MEVRANLYTLNFSIFLADFGLPYVLWHEDLSLSELLN